MLKFQSLYVTLKSYSFDFENSLSSTLRCTICEKVLINAKQSPCGCRFCQDCLNGYLNDGNTICPGNREGCSEQILSDQNLIDDNFANREISELEIKCPNHLCDFMGILRNIDEHIKACEFNNCQCLECVTKNKIVIEGETRIISCEHCGLDFSMEEIETVHHNIVSDQLCDQFKAICPFNCGITDLVILRSHIRVCIKRPVSCPYFGMGCITDNVPLVDLSEHLCRESFEHTKILLEMITNLGNELKNGELLISEKNAEISEWENKLSKVELDLEEVKNENIYLRNDVNETKMEIRDIWRIIKEPKQSGHQNQEIGLLQNEITDLKMVLTKNESDLDTIQRRMGQQDLKYEKKYSDYIWKFENYSRLTEDAKDFSDKRIVYSKPFFTSKNGYRLRLALQPFSHNSAFVSLSFQIMKSRFDDVLEWPYKFDVSLTVLGQNSGQDLVLHLFFDPTNEMQMRSYQKPMEECNPIYGFPEFIKRKHIVMPNFLKDDTIFVRFSSKPINLSE